MDGSLVMLIVAAAGTATALTWVLNGDLGAVRRGHGLWDWVEIGVALFLMLGMLYAAVLQVAVRYALSDFLTIPWTEEGARLLLVWSAFWGAAMIQRSDEHIRMAIIFDLLTPKLQLTLRLLGDLTVLAVLALIVWHARGAVQVDFGMSTVSLGVPVAAFTAALLVGGTLMVIHTSRLLIKHVVRHSNRSDVATER